MTRLPKKRGITQVVEDKSLILRQNSAPVIQGRVQAPQSAKVIKLDGDRISIIENYRL